MESITKTNLKNTSNLLIIIGAIFLLVSIPTFNLALATPPQFPYIPEEWCSFGELDYVRKTTGLHYIACLPQTDPISDVTTCTATFDTGKIISLSLFNKIEYETYNHMNFQKDIDVVSEGLEFNTEYSVTFYVQDTQGRTHTRTETLSFIPVNLDEPMPNGTLTFNGQELSETEITVINEQELELKFTPSPTSGEITGIQTDIYNEQNNLVNAIITIDVNVYPKWEPQTDGTWTSQYTIPQEGIFKFNTSIATSQRLIHLNTVSIQYSGEIIDSSDTVDVVDTIDPNNFDVVKSVPSYPLVTATLILLGVGLIGTGIITKIRKRKANQWI